MEDDSIRNRPDDSRHDQPRVDPPSNESVSQDVIIKDLIQRMGKMEKQMSELEGENRRLSLHGFGFLRGSDMNIAAADQQPLVEEATEEVGRLSTQSLPQSFVAAIRASLSASEHERERREPEQTTTASERRWKGLRHCYENSLGQDFSRTRDLVFLHPEEVGQRDYNTDELHKIQFRPFPSRLFVTNYMLEWNTVWLRTRHTDHHFHHSSFIQVRDAFKADAITNNPAGAKYALTELLNMCYGMNESDYYSFACTIASAFSEKGSNTEFEKDLLMHDERKEAISKHREELCRRDPLMLKCKIEIKLLIEEQKRSRKRLIQLMHIVFSKLRQKRILVDENKDNIYRLVMCMTKYKKGRLAWIPYLYASFSFFFQVCAAAYVALSLTGLDGESDISEWEEGRVVKNMWLAFGTFSYGVMVAWPEMTSTREVFRYLYRSEKSLLSIMDVFVNGFLPISIAICGFLVVLQSVTFLEGVLNAVALLFITEIDDQLPKLLDFDKADIVQGFLIDQAMEEYKEQILDECIDSIEFSDMHITNTQESGSVPTSGVTFQPYEVFGNLDSDMKGSVISIARTSDRNLGAGHAPFQQRPSNKRQGDMGQQVANKRSVTEHCLLRKIEWQYTGDDSGKFDGTSRPRIGHLKLFKLIGGSAIYIVGKQKATKLANKPWFSITGVYIITSFSMSDDILRLRVCGSQTTTSFVKAFQYYNLWPLDRSARALLRSVPDDTATESEKKASRKVLDGAKHTGISSATDDSSIIFA